ncbi:MAG: queuosine precursor transporter [Deltaproteobacteria bacterium]|nr:queuosine precursor transporter [Deltaproteobacteria bacterium]MBN2846148.1 queuosine precursor transporter [Deltaproteobacteria bacterium]
MVVANIRFIKYLFVTSLLLANIMATKIVVIGGLILPAAIILYPLTFLFTDVVSEIEGRESARTLVMTGFYMSIVMVAVLFIGKLLPPAPFWQHQGAYETILGSTPRIVLASMIAYLISQNHDVWAFHWLKKKTEGKYLWLRNNLSTVVSQLIDSVLFIGIAFAGTYPMKTIAVMIVSQYLVKVGIALLDTPFCYLLVKAYGNDRKQLQSA